MMERKYFGTDGIRGRVGDEPMTAPFVLNNEYGTRCSTVLTLSRDGRVSFVERRFGPDGGATGDSNFAFELVRED